MTGPVTGSGGDSNVSVIASPRATKNTDLMSGEVDAIQAYTTTEVPTLGLMTGKDIYTQYLEGLNGAKLGYSQMLFAPREDLEGDKREVVQAFLDATFRGWEMAIRDHEAAAKSVEEAKAMLGLDDEKNDHWDPSFSYTVQNVGLCCDYAKETFQGDKYGVIDAKRWNDATSWLLEGESRSKDVVEENFGLDAHIWQPNPQLLAGNELARTTLEDAKISALDFKEKYGHEPSLAVITLGSLERYTHGVRRKSIYSNDENSWFNKTAVGKSNGFIVNEINLPESTSEEDLLSHLYSVRNCDGIQLMWPLPPHINAAKVYNSIPKDRDVDGAHYIGQMELDSNCSPMAAVTPVAVMDLLDDNDIDVENKSVLVVGRSRIVGSPLAHMLRTAGANVFVAHSKTSKQKLEEMVLSSDIVVTCAGSPGLLCADWVKPGADVINVGTTFIEQKDSLVSDFEGDLSRVAKRFSPVPGGIGPLSIAALFRNVAKAAWDRKASKGNVESTWTQKSGSLYRKIHFKDYDSALNFANKVNTMSSDLDHHANMTFRHKCVNGVDLELEFFTFEANEITEKDYVAAHNVNAILEEQKINMNDYSYELKEESIAKYPADPRGSSRLLRVDSAGNVSHFENFSESFLPLAEGAHIIFNESKVVNGRLEVFPKGANEGIEMMILDLGSGIEIKSDGLQLTVMLRKEGVRVGDILTVPKSDGKTTFKVKAVVGPWIEDEKSNGNGTECIVECVTEEKAQLFSDFLDQVGSVPIPPYLDRDAEDSDKQAYNNVYAAGSGSVAAPTAGLHFTDELLSKIGAENTSFLSLHVGAGTFKPVVTEDARDHSMHGENFSVNVRELNRIIDSIDSGKRMIVVGTTSSRTLESLYWCGVKILRNGIDKHEKSLSLGQNEWAQLALGGRDYSASEALKAVIKGKSQNDFVQGRTSLMIVPGTYDFKVVDELVTNFHAPDSTLMLLVSAFLGSGRKVRDVYHEAQNMGYRFLSYGDVCFFSRSKKRK
mmetsp:Transcript_28967/g.42281  ORF Transcript_28967/g.42281 Transcript_28967/m.42281 type:complete len:1000 (+) Transcript_28967:2-3001(+)